MNRSEQIERAARALLEATENDSCDETYFMRLEEALDLLPDDGDAVGKVVAATGSSNDTAMIQWTSDYRPSVGDLIYSAPRVDAQETERLQTELDAARWRALSSPPSLMQPPPCRLK